MKKKITEILCTSPFHIFTVFVMKNTYFKDRDIGILLLDYSNNSEKLAKKLEETGDFVHVRYIRNKVVYEKYVTEYDRRFVIKYLLNSKKYLMENNISIVDIDEIVFPYYDPVIGLLERELRKKRIKYKLSYFDDGGAPYIEPDNIKLKRHTKLESLLGLKNTEKEYPDDIYMYAPQMCKNITLNQVKKIMVPQTDKFKKKINDFFEYSGKVEPSKIIIFDRCSTSEKESKNEALTFVGIIEKYFDKKDVMVKKHPKRNDDIYEKNGIMIFPEKQTVPFEVCLLNMKEVDDRIFITDFSATNIVPKMLFDYEPKLIFLYKIMNDVWDVSWNKKMDVFINCFKEIYGKKEKIICVENIEELNSAIF